jgi:hypothetical protein
MKGRFFLCSFIMVVLAITNASAQVILDAKKSRKVSTALRSGKISGRISYPKTIGSINDFVNKVRAGFFIYSYKMENGQLTDRKTIAVSQAVVTDVTQANSANYEFDFTIDGVFPFDRPVDVVIGDWCYAGCGGLGGTHIIFKKTSASEYATFSMEDKVYAGFNFKGESKVIPY